MTLVSPAMRGDERAAGADHIPRPGSRITIFVPALVGGGAEQVMLTLAEGFLRRGYGVDVVVVRREGALVSRLPGGVRLVVLGTRHVMTSILALARYLRRERPVALLSTLNTANIAAVWAARLARQRTLVAIRQSNHLSRTLERHPHTGAGLARLIRWSYPYADAVIAVSGGVADDLASRAGVPRQRIHVVPNPIVTAELVRQASVPLADAWFAPGNLPVVLGVGRLTTQKQFDALIRAFALARIQCEARLVILGEGEERPRLERLVRELGLEECVLLPGFVENPAAYMSRARVFVLASAWEGLPGALIQALACGTAVVATDCDSGPREVLQGGRLGRLVPVGDLPALAEAIGRALREPRPPAETLGPDVRYTESAGVESYLRILQGHVDR